ncbi:long polar fimbrial protein LpfD [Enterobacteriaceae bacterium 89]|nr:long polar fimbrial protein LpfD [Enterobacteriaceae bacterium 89]
MPARRSPPIRSVPQAKFRRGEAMRVSLPYALKWNNVMKHTTQFALLISLFSYSYMSSASSYSDYGPCHPANNIPYLYSFEVNQTIEEPDKNHSGALFPDFYKWSSGETYKAWCECPTDPTGAETLFKATSDLPLGHNDGNQFYIVNENLEFSAAVSILNEGYVSVPFADKSNKDPYKECDEDNPSTWGSGGQGNVSLYIRHPFVGTVIIPKTTLLSVYATKKAGVYNLGIPLNHIEFSGYITVPQGCEMDAGSVLEIPFGEFNGRDFKDKKGALPEGATKQEHDIKLKCTNISDGVKIYLRIEGNTNPNDNTSIAMGNDNIGARIEAGGKVLIPNDASSMVEMEAGSLYDETKRDASTSLTTYPVSTTGKVPAGGSYEGIATLRVEVE